MSGERASATRREGGWTLVEVVVVVVLLAIIIVPISNALFQGLTIPGVDEGRSAAAASRSLLTLQYTNDVVGAESATVNTSTLQCPSDPAHSAPDTVVTLAWSDTSSPSGPPGGTPIIVQYQLQYSANTNTTLASVALVRVETRSNGAPASETMLNGYCTIGDPAPMLSASATPSCPQSKSGCTCPAADSTCSKPYEAYEQRVDVRLTLRDSPTDAAHTFDLEAAQRVSCTGVVSAQANTFCGVLGTLVPGGYSAARFNIPYLLAVDSDNNIYVADSNNNVIREIAGKTGKQWGKDMIKGYVYTVAGTGAVCAAPPVSPPACGDGGPATSAPLDNPYGLGVDSAGNLYIGDSWDGTIRIVPKTTPSGKMWGIAGMQANDIYTIAGQERRSCNVGSPVVPCGHDGDAATSTLLNTPKHVIFDQHGNMYVSEAGAGAIREITPDGKIYTVVQGLTHPIGIALDHSDPPNVYAADYGGNLRVLEIAAPGGPAAGTQQWGITMDPGKAYTVVSNGGGSCTLPPAVQCAADAAASTPGLVKNPESVAIDSAGNLYVADSWPGAKILEIPVADEPQGQWNSPTMTAGNAYTVVGGGERYGYPANIAAVSDPRGIAFDASGNLFFTDGGSGLIREVSVASSRVFTVGGYAPPGGPTHGYAGDGTPAATPELNTVGHIASDAAGNVYLAEAGSLQYDNRIREWIASGNAAGEVWTVAGAGGRCFWGAPNPCGDGGPAVTAQLTNPISVATASDGGMYIVDAFYNQVRYVDKNGNISTLAGNHNAACSIAPCGDGQPLTSGSVKFNFTASGNSSGDIAVDASGNYVYIADTGDCTIRKIDIAANTISKVAGKERQCGNSGDGGAATSALLSNPGGIAVGSNGDIYIADTGNNRIRYIDAAGKIQAFAGDGTNHTACSTTPCGDGGPATSAFLNAPTDLVISGASVYIADTGDYAIRKVPLGGGNISTIAGTPLNNAADTADNASAINAHIPSPYGIAVDANGNLIFSLGVAGGGIREIFSPE